MVVIRLSRGGSKKRPFYHVVAISKSEARDSGNFLERLGYFNPMAVSTETRLLLNDERIAHWIKEGAKPSDRVHSLITLAKKTPEQLLSLEKKRAARKAKKAELAHMAAKEEGEAASA